jgi:hypothetical protein
MGADTEARLSFDHVTCEEALSWCSASSLLQTQNSPHLVH